jgi:hypothetical protein
VIAIGQASSDTSMQTAAEGGLRATVLEHRFADAIQTGRVPR